MDRVASTGCVITRELTGQIVPGHVHHLGDGSNPRSHYLTACLAPEYHTGALGIHTLGVKSFCRMFRLPNEWYLLDLQNKFLAEDMSR